MLSCGQNSSTSNVKIGQEGHLDNGTDHTIVAVDEQAFEQFMNAVAAKDSLGWGQMMRRGQLFAVERGTKILVIESTISRRKVRVLEGEHIGKAGWVPFEFVLPFPKS